MLNMCVCVLHVCLEHVCECVFCCLADIMYSHVSQIRYQDLAGHFNGTDVTSPAAY